MQMTRTKMLLKAVLFAVFFALALGSAAQLSLLPLVLVSTFSALIAIALVLVIGPGAGECW